MVIITTPLKLVVLPTFTSVKIVCTNKVSYLYIKYQYIVSDIFSTILYIDFRADKSFFVKWKNTQIIEIERGKQRLLRQNLV